MVHLSFLVGQLARAVARVLVDDVGRLNLGIAGLASLVEEELDEGALQACSLANIYRETGAGNLHTQVKVDEVVFLCQIPVGHSALGQLRHLATGALHDVVLGGATLGYASIRHIRHRKQNLGYLVLSGRHAVFNLLVGSLQCSHLGLYLLGLVALTLLHQGTDLGGHLVKHGGIVVALLLCGTALLVELDHAHDGFAAVEVLHSQAFDDMLGVLVDKL